MKTSEIVYTGDLRTTARHTLSGNQIITDAPPDNQGKGEAFSPTDLLATSLGCCMLTIMGIAARANNFNIDETRVGVTKIMGTNPRRIAEVVLEFYFPGNYSDKQKKLLQVAADTCPVAKSLHPELKQTIHFNFVEG